MEDKKKQIEERRAQLAEKYAGVRLGGSGSQRRKFKSTHKAPMSDAKLDSVMKKFNTQPIPDIAEVNMFTKDQKIISFQKPQVHASFQTQTMIVSGNPVTKDLKSSFSEVMNQLGPRQLEALKQLGISQAEKKTEETTNVNFQQVSEKK